jgi:putative NIF3 family GTP cyclohydrolase 1 type 2
MKLGEIYRKAIYLGMKNDPRSEEVARKDLERAQKEFEELKEDQKKEFDRERLDNPYADTRLLYGEKEREVKRALVGIDMEVGEVLLAERLGEKGKKVDLLLSHHPEGRALASLYEVMGMQADILHKYGVPIAVAEGILEGRIKEVQRRLMPSNHTRSVDVAALLDIPFLCVHTPADNMVTTYLQKILDEKKPFLVKDVLDLLKEIPEYQEGIRNHNGPNLQLGSEKRRAGKIFVDMTGGTGGSKEAFEKIARTDIGTIVGMHIGEDHRTEAEKNHLNVIIAGHIPSDTLGVNLFLDEVEREGKLDIIACSGFRRVSRP